ESPDGPARGAERGISGRVGGAPGQGTADRALPESETRAAMSLRAAQSVIAGQGRWLIATVAHFIIG
ncbi:hypothetical protein ACW9VS_06395, partial [Bifidobacterium adolescentis]